jgi:hypothetical protein
MALEPEASHLVLNAVAMRQHLWPWLTTDFFARPWEISGPGNLIEMPKGMVNHLLQRIKIGKEWKTFHQMRQQKYEQIVDETLFIARASEGAVSAEWVMEQPIFIRTKYVEQLDKEMKERQKQMASSKK